MSKVFKLGHSTLTSYLDDITKDIIKAEIVRRKRAITHAARVMRKNIGKKGKSLAGRFPTKYSGTLRKSIKTQAVAKVGDGKLSIIGSTDSKAHLIEFGHGDGKSKNKRPFFNATLIAEEPKMIEIMSEKYW